MASSHQIKLTADLLRAYSDAALLNAEQLLGEASLLLAQEHMARAYFLAVASIEEAGKALLAFDAQNRNLSDPAVCSRLKGAMESHSKKTNYALGVWAMNSPDQREALKVAIDLIIHLKHGREPSMYTDLRSDPDRVQTPSEVVRASAASDCVRLAENCLANARKHLREKAPATFTSAQDKMFTMKAAQFQRMLSTEDFWWYYISRMESGQQDLAEAVLGYEQDHIKTGTQFRTVEQPASIPS